MIEGNDFVATGIKILPMTNFSLFGYQDLMISTRRLDLEHLLGVVLTEGRRCRFIDNGLIRQ